MPVLWVAGPAFIRRKKSERHLKITPFEKFRKEAKPGCRVPIVGQCVIDLDTPVSLYQVLAREKYSFLLESAEKGKKWGRYSFMGFSPSLIFRSRGKNIEIIEGNKKKSFKSNDPLDELRKAMNRYSYTPSQNEDLPRFAGGAVGMVAYDMVRFFEKIPDETKDDLKTPDLFFIIPEILLVCDNHEQTLKIVYDARIGKKASLKKEYDRGCRLIQKVERLLSRQKNTPPQKLSSPKWKLNLAETQYHQMVERIRDYTLSGDITQTVLSIRFQASTRLQPLALYRALRRINPSPYMFLLKYDTMNLVGASPETMVRLENGEMTVRPIAGTRPRGKDEAHDLALEKDLLADVKERAEHIMLVDLGRNDLGRVATSGSVKVDELMKIERYSHVMHIVSNVRATLAPHKDAFDLLRATFPAGTLSGSPKVRAMEIIEELEPTRRGFYGGCVGYFSFSGNMDMAITIRSALIQKGKITVQVGAGLVADSQPQMEYQECVNKAKAVMKAIEIACGREESE